MHKSCNKTATMHITLLDNGNVEVLHLCKEHGWNKQKAMHQQAAPMDLGPGQAAMPGSGALEATGMTQLIADSILAGATGIPVYLVLGFILVVTMSLSDIMNNAATAVVMAPIGVAVATGLGASPDAFLMAVAIGASSAFLTPIGHQNNALVMGPGGYHFGDYWRVGLPLEVIIVVVAVPLLMWFWPV